MGSLLAMLTQDPARLRCQLGRLLAAGAPVPDEQALGVATYADDAAILAKRPGGLPHLLPQLVRDVRSRSLVTAWHEAPYFDEAATDPFRFRRWVFAMDGEVRGFDRVRSALVKGLPDLLARAVRGETDREHVFALFLRELKAQGRLDDPTVAAPEAARCLGDALRALDKLGREADEPLPSQLSAVATNGRVLVAARRGRPLGYALLEGMRTCEVCELDERTADDDPRVLDHRRAKAVAISTLALPGTGVLDVPDGSVVGVGRGLDVAVASL